MWQDVARDRVVQAKLPPRDRTVTMPPGLPEFTLGYEALAWIEHYLRVVSGPYAGDAFECTADQALFLVWWYAVNDRGEWLFNRGVRRRSKGSGKSPFAAALAFFELVGPARFDRFDSDVPGGVVGKPTPLSLVQFAATSETQTGVTMRHVRAMGNPKSLVRREFGLDVGKTYVDTAAGGKLQLLTSSASSAEGHEPSLVIADETEHWLPSNGGVDMHRVLLRNLSKTGARMVETCNAWEPGAESVAEKSFNDWVDQEEGKLDEDVLTLYDARVAPSNAVLHDSPLDGQIGLSETLAFMYEEHPWANLRAIRTDILTPSTKPSESMRFYFNKPAVSQDAWLDDGEWAALADPGRELVPGEEVVLFFDGSKSNDHTALVGCCMSDGFVFTVGVWEPGAVSGVVDTNSVDAAVRRMRDEFYVVAFFADVREFESYVKTSWPALFDEVAGEKPLLVEAQKLGKAAAPIAWDMRSHGYDFAAASEQCRAEIERQEFRHDGNWVTAKHVGNCRVMERRGFWTVKKESPKSPNKIDAAVCVIGARMVYNQVKRSVEWENYVGSSEDWTVWV